MIGERIRQLRLDKGLSLSELAVRAGVAKSYLSNVERNIQFNPSIHFLEKIVEVLNISLEGLLYPDRAVNEDHLDPEWSKIFRKMVESGVRKDELLDFIEFNKWRQTQRS
jgi:XRE family transcriptional regulator of biofilm formation